MWRGFAPRRSVQSGHLCCRFQPILYDNSVYLFRHTSTPKAYLGFSLGQERRYKDSNLDNDFTRWRDQRSPVIPLHHICIAEQFPFFTCSTLPQVQVSFSQRLAPSFEWQPLNPVPCAKFNRYIDQHLHFCNKRTRGVLATTPIEAEGFEPPTFTFMNAPAYELRLETAIRRLAIIFFVPCVALSGLQPFTRNSLFDSSGTVGQMPELSIGIRLYCSSANYGTTIIQHQAVFRLAVLRGKRHRTVSHRP